MGDDGTDNPQPVTDLLPDCYAILGVRPNAEEAVIHEAFETLAERYDPEHFAGSKDEAHQKLSELASAYAILSDPIKRRRYDLRRRIDALIAPQSATDATRQKGPSRAAVDHSGGAPRSRRYQVVLTAVLGALIVVVVAAFYQYSARPNAERLDPGRAASPVGGDAKPAPITQPTTSRAEVPAQPSTAGANAEVTIPAAPQAAAASQKETRPAPQKPAIAKTPVNRAADAGPAAVATESCSDVAIVLGLCKRKPTVKDK